MLSSRSREEPLDMYIIAFCLRFRAAQGTPRPWLPSVAVTKVNVPVGMVLTSARGSRCAAPGLWPGHSCPQLLEGIQPEAETLVLQI